MLHSPHFALHLACTALCIIGICTRSFILQYGIGPLCVHDPLETDGSMWGLRCEVWGVMVKLLVCLVCPVRWMMYGLEPPGIRRTFGWLCSSSAVKTLDIINLGSVGSDCRWHIVTLLPGTIQIKYVVPTCWNYEWCWGYIAYILLQYNYTTV